MASIGSQLKQSRLNLGLTQSELAYLARLSLPAIQKIESGESAPNWSTLNTLASILNIQITLSPTPLDLSYLQSLGIPLMAKSSGISAHPHELPSALAHACSTLLQSTDERLRDALHGMILALRIHFPSIHKKLIKRSEAIRRVNSEIEINGRIIKLKRIALSKLCEYL